jgi:hypothetical protein
MRWAIQNVTLIATASLCLRTDGKPDPLKASMPTNIMWRFDGNGHFPNIDPHPNGMRTIIFSGRPQSISVVSLRQSSLRTESS